MSEEERLLIKYSRLSLEDSDTEESNSIKNQKKLIDDYVEEREDLKSLNSLELWDDGYTGTNFNRPGIKKFFELLKKNKVACLLGIMWSRYVLLWMSGLFLLTTAMTVHFLTVTAAWKYLLRGF